jgi:hypothetical protein
MSMKIEIRDSRFEIRESNGVVSLSLLPIPNPQSPIPAPTGANA